MYKAFRRAEMREMEFSIERWTTGRVFALWQACVQHIESFGPHGFRAVLWHQGESDSNQKPEHEIRARHTAGCSSM